MANYDCSKCPGYCCSYPSIRLGRADVARLARHFGLTFDVAERRFTRKAYGLNWVMRRKADTHYGKICRFFDTQKRNCSVYAVRPATCRAFPGEAQCGYWDFLSWERRHQQDDTHIATTDSSQWP